jgi:predicted nucleotidyltransferase component of viral defense system
MKLELTEIRKLTLTALFSDDVLFDQLVLKGGNAISLVHRISPRDSLDLDFSLEADFEDPKAILARMERALTDRFSVAGFVPFDVKLVAKPSEQHQNQQVWWGGYELEFKLIEEARQRSFGVNLDRLRREALVVGPNQQRTFRVDFSKYEYTAGKIQAEIDNYTIFVYTPAMIAIEKLRALCQQMEDYAPTGETKRARARDFFDIFIIVTKTGVQLGSSENLELIKMIFEAKQVPTSLLAKLAQQRDYHRDDWPNVRATVAEPLEEFDYYFDLVVKEIEPLHSLWVK